MVLDQGAWRPPEIVGDDPRARPRRRPRDRPRGAGRRLHPRRDRAGPGGHRRARRDGAPRHGASCASASSSGVSVMVVAELAGEPVAAGMHQPVGEVTEIVGVATLPAVRRQGLGGAVTGALVEHALADGVETVFLSAGQRGHRARLRAARVPPDRDGVHRRLSAIDAFLDAGPRPQCAASRRSARSRCSSRRSRGRTTRGRGSASRTTFTPADVEAVRDRQRELRVPAALRVGARDRADAARRDAAAGDRGAAARARGAHRRRPSARCGCSAPTTPRCAPRSPSSRSASARPGPASAARPRPSATRRRSPARCSTAVRERLRGGHERHRGGRGRRPARSPSARCARSTTWPRSSPSPPCRPLRRQGLGAAVTAALVEHALGRGIETVFLSAADDDVARVYERLGFRRAATACFVQ